MRHIKSYKGQQTIISVISGKTVNGKSRKEFGRVIDESEHDIPIGYWDVFGMKLVNTLSPPVLPQP